jgi:hypothetical protein
MLLLIGLLSGKGLHPDRIFKLPEFQIAKDRRKFPADQFLFHPNCLQ